MEAIFAQLRTNPQYDPATHPVVTEDNHLSRIRRQIDSGINLRITLPTYQRRMQPSENDLARAGNAGLTLMDRVITLGTVYDDVRIEFTKRPESIYWEDRAQIAMDWRISGLERGVAEPRPRIQLIESDKPLAMRFERTGADWRLTELAGEIARIRPR